MTDNLEDRPVGPLRPSRVGREGVVKDLQRLRASSDRIERDGVDVDVPLILGGKVRGLTQFAERVLAPLLPDEGKTERIVHARVLRRGRERRPQHRFAVLVPTRLPIKVGEIDGGGRELRCELQCGPVFRLGLRGPACSRVKAAEGQPRLRPVGVELRPGWRR